MKTFTLELVINEGCDEFWESNPNREDIEEMIEEALKLSNINGIATLKKIEFED